MYAEGRIIYSPDTRLADWQRQIEANHTWIGFDSQWSPSRIAEEIYNQLLAHFFQIRGDRLSQNSIDIEDVPDEILGFLSSQEDSDIERLEERYARQNDIELVDEIDNSVDIAELLRHPNKIAAREHREEAMLAIELQAYGVAIQHLIRALALRPLDLASNFWLAKLYLAMGRKDKYRDVVELSEKAIKIAQKEATPYKVAACYLMAADASAMADKYDEAISYSSKAVESAPNFSKAYIGLARHLVSRSENVSKALGSIEKAYQIYPPSIREVITNPVFKSILPKVYGFLNHEKDKYIHHLDSIVRAEEQITHLCDSSRMISRIDVDQGASIRQIQEIGKKSIRRQWELVCNALKFASELHFENKIAEENSTGRLAKLSDDLQKSKSKYAQAEASINADTTEDVSKLRKPFLWQQITTNSWLFIISGILITAFYWPLQVISVVIIVIAIQRYYWDKETEKCVNRVNQERKQKLNEALENISLKEAEIKTFTQSVHQSIMTAEHAKKVFEACIAELPQKILPFKSLVSANTGDLAVLSKKRLEVCGKTVNLLRDSCFPWIEAPDEIGQQSGLIYIESINGNVLVGSIKNAYLLKNNLR